MLKIDVTSALVLALIIQTGAGPQPLPSTPQPLDEPEAYKVYAALLPDEWIVREARAKILVFQQETATYPRCMPSGTPLETEWLSVVKDFRAANATPKLLHAGFDLGVPYVVVPSADIRAMFQSPGAAIAPGWVDFYQQYPDSGGYMFVSAVGFDASKRRAMVYMAHSCGGLCGGGTYHFLEKIGGAWRHARLAGLTNCVWAS